MTYFLISPTFYSASLSILGFECKFNRLHVWIFENFCLHTITCRSHRHQLCVATLTAAKSRVWNVNKNQNRRRKFLIKFYFLELHIFKVLNRITHGLLVISSFSCTVNLYFPMHFPFQLQSVENLNVARKLWLELVHLYTKIWQNEKLKLTFCLLARCCKLPSI